MSRYIDADALIQWLKNVWDLESEWTNEVSTITALKQTITDIENQPTADVVKKEKWDRLLENSIILAEAVQKYQLADVVEVKHGEWIELYENNYKCSDCGDWWETIEGTPQDNGMNYCPHCGARMDERGEE